MSLPAAHVEQAWQSAEFYSNKVGHLHFFRPFLLRNPSSVFPAPPLLSLGGWGGGGGGLICFCGSCNLFRRRLFVIGTPHAAIYRYPPLLSSSIKKKGD